MFPSHYAIVSCISKVIKINACFLRFTIVMVGTTADEVLRLFCPPDITFELSCNFITHSFTLGPFPFIRFRMKLERNVSLSLCFL